MNVIKLQIIENGRLNPPLIPYTEGSNTRDTLISSGDRLTISYNTQKFKYYVNGVMIHEYIPSASQFTNGDDDLYGIVSLSNSSSTNVKECAIVDLQMGTYEIQNTPDLIIGGNKKYTKRNRVKVRV
jgi:hypothetical protein